MDFQQHSLQIEALVRKVESLTDPTERASVFELLKLVMDLNGAGFERMMDIVFETGDSGRAIIDRFAGDNLIAGLLLLYGLHPLDLESRVTQALDKVRPYLRSHGGNVELLGVHEGVVRLQLEGSCNGCASSAQTLKLAIEDAIYDAAPDLARLAIEGVVESKPATPLVQLGKASNLQPSKPVGNGKWEDVAGVESFDRGSVKVMEVGGSLLLFCRLGDSLYAYKPRCPGCAQTLEGASLEATTLKCPSCGQGYDVVRAGRALDRPHLQLEPMPLLVDKGRARVAVNQP